MTLCTNRWPQIDDEGDDVESEDKGDCPLEYGGSVAVARECSCCESDSEEQLEQNERELDPERDPKYPLIAVLCGN